MKEGFIIKLNWIVYKNEIIKNIPLLTVWKSPKSISECKKYL